MCQSDLDCNERMVCYNTSWTLFNATCGCHTLNGFKGEPSCLQILSSPNSIFSFICIIFFLINWSAFIVVLLKYAINVPKKFRVLLYCQFQFFVSSILFIVHFGAELQATIDPSGFGVIIPGTTNKASSNYLLQQLTTSTACSMLFLAVSTLPVLWKDAFSYFFQKKLSYRFGYTIAIFQLSFFLCAFVPAFFSNSFLSYVLAIPFVLVVICIYGIAAYVFHDISMKAKFSNDDNKKRRLLNSARNISKTGFQAFVFSLFILILGVAQFMLQEPIWREISPPNIVSPNNVITYSLFLAYVGVAWSCQMYVIKTILIQNDKQTTLKTSSKDQQDQIIQPSSVQPDSIVLLEDSKDIKRKNKLMKRMKPKLKVIQSENTLSDQ